MPATPPNGAPGAGTPQPRTASARHSSAANRAATPHTRTKTPRKTSAGPGWPFRRRELPPEKPLPSSTGVVTQPSSVRRLASRARPSWSMEEVPCPGEVQADSRTLRGLDHLAIADRPAGLHDGTDSGVGQHLQAVREREVRVARGDRALGALA